MSNKLLAKLGTDGFSLVLFGTKVSVSKEFCKISNFFKHIKRIDHVVAILIIGIIIRLFYQEKYTVMVFQHDWQGHIEMLKYFAHHWSLPLPTKGLEFPQQPLYYIITATIYNISMQLGFSDKSSLEFIGYFSFFCSILFLIYGYKFINLLSKEKWVKITSMIFLALTPSIVYMSARINNDALVMALSASSLYYIVKSYQGQFKNFFYRALISVSLLFLTKISAGGIELLFFALIILSYHQAKENEVKLIEKRLYLFSLVGLFLIAFTLWRVYLPLNGTFYMINSSGDFPNQQIKSLNLDYFISFNFTTLFQAGQSYVFGEDSIRYSLPTYQYGTMFFGEFDYTYFTNQMPWLKATMQGVLLLGLIFIVGLLSYIINLYKTSTLEKFLFATLLINFILILKLMFDFPSICNTDFRYFASSFLIFAFLFAQGLEYLSKIKFLKRIIRAWVLLLMLNEIIFFIILNY